MGLYNACNCWSCEAKHKAARETRRKTHLAASDWNCSDCGKSWYQYLHYPCNGRLKAEPKPNGGQP